MSALRRKYPRPWNTTERGNSGEDPERHRTQTEEVARHVLRQAGNQEDDKAQDGALRFDDEPHLLPHVGADELLNVSGPKPPTDGEGGHGTQRQSNRRVEKPNPLPK